MTLLAAPDGGQEMTREPRLVHLILTRFNCRFKGGDFPTRNQPGWLEHRFQLFERYCLPTMQVQTSSNFEWILFFDSETPKPFLDRAAQLFQNYPHFHLHQTDLYSGEWLIDDLRRHLSDRCDWLISTRLDNDDGLNATFVEQLQENVSIGRTEALNFPLGLVFSEERLYVSHQSSNAFLSVSEPFDAFRTALHAPHKEMKRYMPLRDIAADPMWIQIIHDANVSNKRRGRRLLRKNLPAGFGSIVDFRRSPPHESAIAAHAENLTLSLVRSARDMASQAARQMQAKWNRR